MTAEEVLQSLKYSEAEYEYKYKRVCIRWAKQLQRQRKVSISPLLVEVEREFD